MKPLFDDVLLPHASLVQTAEPSDWISKLGIFGANPDAEAPPFFSLIGVTTVVV